MTTLLPKTGQGRDLNLNSVENFAGAEKVLPGNSLCWAWSGEWSLGAQWLSSNMRLLCGKKRNFFF